MIERSDWGVLRKVYRVVLRGNSSLCIIFNDYEITSRFTYHYLVVGELITFTAK